MRDDGELDVDDDDDDDDDDDEVDWDGADEPSKCTTSILPFFPPKAPSSDPPLYGITLLSGSTDSTQQSTMRRNRPEVKRQ